MDMHRYVNMRIRKSAGVISAPKMHVCLPLPLKGEAANFKLKSLNLDPKQNYEAAVLKTDSRKTQLLARRVRNPIVRIMTYVWL